MKTLIRTTTLPLLILIGTGELAAQERPDSATASKAETSHVVRRGDTLWDLARRYLSNPFLWPDIFDANRSQIRNPHLIFPAQRLTIPPVSTAVAVEGADTARAAPATPVAVEVPFEPRPMTRTRFFAGGAAVPSAVEEERPSFSRAGREEPVVQPGEFYSAAWLAQSNELPVLGRFVDKRARGNLKRHEAQWAHPHEALYLSYEGASRPQIGDALLLARVGRKVSSYGRIVQPTAIVRVTALAPEVMTVVVEQQFDRVQHGDVALPLERFPLAPGAELGPALADVQGKLVEFIERQALHGPTDRAFVDLGEAHGIGIGDELLAYVPERRSGGLGSERLPAEPIARMVVLRTTDRTSTVQITHIDQPVLEDGLPVRVVRQTR